MRWIRAAFAWLVDQAIEHWPAVLLAIAGGGGMTYLASVSTWLDQYGPIAWATAGLLSAMSLAVIYWLYSTARLKLTHATYIPLQYKSTESINPLESVFHKRRIKIQDLVDPVSRDISGKTFTDCDLVGPANLLMVDDCTISEMGFMGCNLVLVNKNFTALTLVQFHHIHITRGRIIGATIFVTPAVKEKMGQLAVDADQSWVNQ